MNKYLILIITGLISISIFAHSGRTNSQGCHNDRKNGGYHCHNSGTEYRKPSSARKNGDTVLAYKKELKRLLTIGLQMKSLRNSGGVMQCMPLMRKYKPQAEVLDKKISSLGNEHIMLKVASTQVRMCLICLKGSADYQCEEANKYLNNK
jgi:hypothetical protein